MFCVFFPNCPITIVCVLCFLPIHSGHQVRWTYQPGSHRIFHPPSFCGACLNFSREKDSVIPFPRQPLSRILCTNDLIVLHSLGNLFLFYSSEKNPIYRNQTHVPTCQKVTRLPLSYWGVRNLLVCSTIQYGTIVTIIYDHKCH